MSDETVDDGTDIGEGNDIGTKEPSSACHIAGWLKWLTSIIGALGGVSSAIGGILGMHLEFFIR